jgi:hypothetical protein
MRVPSPAASTTTKVGRVIPLSLAFIVAWPDMQLFARGELINISTIIDVGGPSTAV